MFFADVVFLLLNRFVAFLDAKRHFRLVSLGKLVKIEGLTSFNSNRRKFRSQCLSSSTGGQNCRMKFKYDANGVFMPSFVKGGKLIAGAAGGAG